MKEILLEKIDWKKTDGLIPAIVQDAESGAVLMHAYMSRESLLQTLDCRRLTFFSRTKQRLWTKGETTGHWLDFVSVALDCDGDTLLFQARPNGAVCHLGTDTCFGEAKADGFLNKLTQIIEERFAHPENQKSYTAELIRSGLDRMAQKVGEEAIETVIAAKNNDLALFEGEAADLLFHLMILLRAKGSSLPAVTERLRQRNKPQGECVG